MPSSPPLSATGAASWTAKRMLTTSTWSPRFSSKPIALFTRPVMRSSSSAARGCQACLPSAPTLSVPSTITARLMRSICGCSRISVRTVLLIS